MRGCSGPVPAPVISIALAISTRFVRRELDPTGIDPAVDLLGASGADDGAGHAGPGERPGDGDGGHRRAMPHRDGAKSVPEREVPAEARVLEIGRAASPVLGGHGRHAVGGEGVRQDPRLHRAVDDDPRVVGARPWDHVRGTVAADEREGRLEGVDVLDHLGPVEKRDVEVGDADRTDLALVAEADHLGPRIFDGGAGLIGPMELIQVDAVDCEPPQGCLEFPADRRRLEVADGLLVRPGGVGNHAALGEHVGTVVHRDLAQRLADDLL